MYAAADPDTPGWNFDPGNPGNAVADVRLREWMADHESRPLTVQRMSSDRCGGFVLHLSGDYALEVFPTGADGVHEDREQWRLFEPGMGKPHFVWTDRGILERGD